MKNGSFNEVTLFIEAFDYNTFDFDADDVNSYSFIYHCGFFAEFVCWKEIYFLHILIRLI